MNVSENIAKYVEYKGISINKFSAEIGVSNSYFSKQSKINGSIGSKIVQEIVKKYEDLNIDWLISGRGEMLREVAIKSNFNPEIERFLNLKNVFSEIFERLDKLEQNTDGLAIGHTVNEEIAKIIDKKIIKKK